MKKLPRISSGFAILDVKNGRNALHKHLMGRDRQRREPYRVPVTIQGFIISPWGGDDGISREFEIDVTSVEIEQPEVM